MYCNICQQPKHGHMELCPQWKDDGQDGYMPDKPIWVTKDDDEEEE